MVSLFQLNSASDKEFIIILGGIYEHSDWVPQRTLSLRPFANAEALRSAMKGTVDQASEEEKLALIQAHPDLAGKLFREGTLTLSSTREQAGLGLDLLTDEEYRELTMKNQGYRERFGFPFIICARLTTKQGVLDAFAGRMKNSPTGEILEAISQIHEIARLRLQDLMNL